MLQKACIFICLISITATIGCGGGAGNSSSATTSPGTGGAIATPTVSILSPQPNATVTGPFRVHATVSDSTTPTLHLLLDGIEVFTDQASVLDTTITAPDGPHQLSVRAMNSAGTTTEANVNFVASSPVTDPAPVFSAITDRVEERSDWLTCGNCGNTGATGDAATYLMERGLSDPATDGSSARFSIGGPFAYKNAYWYIKQTAPTARISQLRYEFDLYIPAEFANAPQAIEFECQQQSGGYIYNFAWQADFGRKIWRTFDYVNKVWDPTSIALTQLTVGTWHHIVAEYRTASGTVYHDALTIDGTRYDVNVTHAAKYVGGTSKQFTNAFQLDLNKTPTPYTVYVDAMKVSYN